MPQERVENIVAVISIRGTDKSNHQILLDGVSTVSLNTLQYFFTA